MDDFVSALLRFAAVTTRVTYSFIRRHWVALMSLAVFVLSFHALWLVYDAAADREIVIYTGLPGSDCHEIAARLERTLSKHCTAYGSKYRVRMEETNGADEIHERVRQDTTGRAVGFAQDEHGNAPEALAVAPLELDYLHVIVGPRLLDRLVKAELAKAGADRLALVPAAWREPPR